MELLKEFPYLCIAQAPGRITPSSTHKKYASPYKLVTPKTQRASHSNSKLLSSSAKGIHPDTIRDDAAYHWEQILTTVIVNEI
jgi:hypothetical protein